MQQHESTHGQPRAKKSLGQHFLKREDICRRIAMLLLPRPEDMVLEIGPGPGALTRAIEEQTHARLLLLEKDNHWAAERQRLGKARTQAVLTDALRFDWRRITPQTPWKIIGNLPYYITTPIIMKILEEGVLADSITIMMQKEVADRLKAPPGSRTYGAISAAVAYYCRVDHVANVPKEVFIPQPKVDSSVLKLSLRKEKPLELANEKLFFQCIKAGFGQRRKTLLNSLTGVSGYTKEQVESALSEAGIDSKRRAETLGIEEFGKIANALQRKL